VRSINKVYRGEQTLKIIVVVLSVFALATVSAHAQQPPLKASELKVGDKAPDFEITKAGQDKEGSPSVKLSSLQGKRNVLVAFYPKAFTPGCTTQLCGYRDDFARFQRAETDVVAISLDPQAESDRFKKEKEFPFRVVSDAEAAIVKAYGVPLFEKDGARLAKRSVFLIDKAGVVRYIDPDYDVAKGKEPLYAALEKISAPKTPGSGQKLRLKLRDSEDPESEMDSDAADANFR
jgi:thioredoxin-dependent peroxiredoxin